MITQTDNGKAVQVHAGDTLVIQLDENASTGYTWAVNKIDTTVLLLQGSTYTASGNVPGSGAHESSRSWRKILARSIFN